MTRGQGAAFIRVGNVESLPGIFESLGLNVALMLAAVGLTRETFEQPEALIPFVSIDELLWRGSRASGCAHIGLLIGMTPPNLGLPGFVMFNAPSVRAGLRDLLSALDRVDTGGAIVLDEGDTITTLGYAVTINELKSVDHITDIAIAVGYGIMRRLVGSSFRPIEIRFQRRGPADIAPYKAFFENCRIRFGAPAAGIDFATSCLDRAIPASDANLYTYLKTLVALNPDSASMADRIRRVLPTVVRQGPTKNGRIARLFDMNSRTLTRRLAEESITLRDLVGEARFEIARQLLRDTDIGVTDIAAHLYYADASSFVRAFRRKYGEAPGDWRKKQRLGG